MSEWQPIETAPRNGTRMLVAWLGNPAINRLHFRVRDKEWCDEQGLCYRQPTHWMPLPEPPKA